MKNNILLKKQGVLPLFDVAVTLILAHDVGAAARSLGAETDPRMVYEGMAMRDGRRVAVILDRSKLTHGLIAHELFHATHGVMDTCSAAFSMEHQEPFAYVNEWFHTWVYAALKKGRLRIR